MKRWSSYIINKALQKKNIQDFLKAPSANTDVFTYIIDLKFKSFFVIYSHSVFLLPAGGYASVAL